MRSECKILISGIILGFLLLFYLAGYKLLFYPLILIILTLIIQILNRIFGLRAWIQNKRKKSVDKFWDPLYSFFFFICIPSLLTLFFIIGFYNGISNGSIQDVGIFKQLMKDLLELFITITTITLSVTFAIVTIPEWIMLARKNEPINEISSDNQDLRIQMLKLTLIMIAFSVFAIFSSLYAFFVISTSRSIVEYYIFFSIASFSTLFCLFSIVYLGARIFQLSSLREQN